MSILLSAAVLLCSNNCIGQVKNIGKVISYKKVAGGIEGKTATAIFDIHAYSDNIIRVRVSKNKSFNNFSYALTDNQIPSFNNFIWPNNASLTSSNFCPSLALPSKNKTL